MFPLALGTQTGGSVIRPASFCGIYGLKPTFGLISRTGVTMQSHTLDTVGVYGRSVEDLALIADALSAHDPRRPRQLSAQPAGPARAAATEQAPVKPLFAYVKTPMWHLTDDVAKDAFAELVAELGNLVEEIEMPSLETVVANHAIVHGGGERRLLRGLADRAGDAISAGLRARIEAGRKVSAETYIKAVNAREARASNIDAILIELHRHPDAGLDRTGAQDPRLDRQSDLQRAVDLSRPAVRDAAAARGRRPADRGAADRRPPRRRAAAAHRPLAAERCISINQSCGSGRALNDAGSRDRQYVARPPEMSNTAPVVNELSAEASQATIAAISSTLTKRLRGIFDSMKSMCCLRDLVEDRGLGRSRRHRVDGDVVAGQLLAQRFGQRDHACLGGRVVRRVRIAFLAGDRGDVHDPPVLLLDHPRHHRLASS